MTLFSKIISGELPSYKVAEDEKFYAFLDINPITWGHTLVVPRQEVDYIFDLDDKTIGEMTVFAKRVAKCIKEVIPCKKVGMAVLGMEVPHAHIHLVPLKKDGDMDFKNKIENPSPEKMTEIAMAIFACYKNLEDFQ